MDIDGEPRSQSRAIKHRSASVSRDRSVLGLRNVKVNSNIFFNIFQQKAVATSMMYKVQKKSNLMAKRGESDREIRTKMPKHLFSGKRGMGKTSHR